MLGCIGCFMSEVLIKCVQLILPGVMNWWRDFSRFSYIMMEQNLFFIPQNWKASMHLRGGSWNWWRQTKILSWEIQIEPIYSISHIALVNWSTIFMCLAQILWSPCLYSSKITLTWSLPSTHIGIGQKELIIFLLPVTTGYVYYTVFFFFFEWPSYKYGFLFEKIWILINAIFSAYLINFL